MTASSVLFQCLPAFFFLGCGVNFLLTALVPSWRGKSWRDRGSFGPRHTAYGEHPLLASFVFFREPKPHKDADWDSKTAVRLYLWMGAGFLLLGTTLIIAVVRTSMV